MTIDRTKQVSVPMWLVSVMGSVLTASFIVWGVLSSLKSKQEMQNQTIETLRREKVDRNEFNIVMTKLNSIEMKLDNHIAK